MKQIDLSALREIGWREWDPIGIRQFGGDAWKTAAADEYDTYLSKVTAGLQSGWTLDDAAKYLVDIERDYIGLGEGSTSRPRAEATAKAIASLVGKGAS
jgi:hypothetical protein